jgi:hydrogenase maturation protease
MTRIIGVGSAYGGDDSVGLVVAQRLRAAGFDAHTAPDVTSLVTLLGDAGRAIVIDALVGAGESGRVVHLSEDALRRAGSPRTSPGEHASRMGVSSHGLGIVEAIALARALGREGCAKEVHVIGIAIELPCVPGDALSVPVAAAVDEAVSVAQKLAGD